MIFAARNSPLRIRKRSKTDRQYGTIVEMVLVGEVSVSKDSVGVERLGSQCSNYYTERKRTYSDEIVLAFTFHEKDSDETDTHKEGDDAHAHVHNL